MSSAAISLCRLHVGIEFVRQVGKLIDDVGWCWDHADGRHVIAHDELIATSVCPSEAHYPIAWRRCKKKAAWAADACKAHTHLCLEVIDDAIARDIPGDYTFDRSLTHAKVRTHIHRPRRHDVGDLKRNRKGVVDGHAQQLPDVARHMPWEGKKAGRIGKRRAWSFSTRRRMPPVDHPVRIVLVWQERSDLEASKAVVRNRLTWEVRRMLVVYRHRWQGTATVHRDGTQPWGLGDGQVRSGAGQTRHGSLVSVASSLLMHTVQQNRPHEWARRLLSTIGEAGRAVKGELLAQLVDWMVDKLADDHWSVPPLKAVLAQA